MSPRIALLFAIPLIGIVSPARAEPSGEALTKEAVQLRRDRRDAEALAVFERALAVDGSPRTRAQVALAEQALGLWVEAERDLSEALEAGDDAWFQQHRVTLQSALDLIRARLATLEVDANVVGAELRINGLRAGELPLSAPLRVVAGTVTIDVRSSGFETQFRTVHIPPQAHAREVLTLAKLPEAQSTGSVDPAQLPQPPQRSSTAQDVSTRATTDRESLMTAGAWVSLASSLVLLAGAGVSLLERNFNATTYNNDSLCFYGGLTRDERCHGYRDAVSTWQTLAMVEAQAAVAATGLSIVLFTLAPKARAHRLASVDCTLAMGFRCDGSF